MPRPSLTSLGSQEGMSKVDKSIMKLPNRRKERFLILNKIERMLNLGCNLRRGEAAEDHPRKRGVSTFHLHFYAANRDLRVR